MIISVNRLKKTGGMKAYHKWLRGTPQDSLEDNWLQWLIGRAVENDEVIKITPYFVIVKALTHVNPEYAPDCSCHTSTAKSHIVAFTTEPVSYWTDGSPHAKVAFSKLCDALKGWRMYISEDPDKSITRFHAHFVSMGGTYKDVQDRLNKSYLIEKNF